MGNILLVMIFLPLAGAVLVALAGSQHPAFVRWLSLLTTVATFVLAVVVIVAFESRPELETTPRQLNEEPIQPQMKLRADWLTFDWRTSDGQPHQARLEFYLGIDGISLWLVGLTALLMIPSVLVSWESITERVAEYYALLLVLETGLLGVFCSFDLILFYVFFEFTLIPLFFLIGIWGGPERRYAARKFFIYTLAGSLITLVGLVAFVLTLYSPSNPAWQILKLSGVENPGLTFSIPELARDMSQQLRIADANATVKEYWFQKQTWIFLALFLGFAIKVPLVPFHTWLPLAHTEAPTAGSVLLAGVLLKLGTYGFLRLCLPLLPYASLNLGVPLVAGLAVVGIIYGALCALAQADIKKLVAYSSVSHLGFCMLGMFALNAQGLTGSVVQMINHGLSTGALFLLVGMLYERYHTRQISDYSGMAARLPLLATLMVFMCLSSIGLPGLNGFVGEMLCLIGMFKAHTAYAVAGTAGIILGAWYLLSMLQRVFFGPLREPEHGEEHVTDLKPRELAALAPIVVMCVWIGVYPKTFVDVIRPDVQTIERIYQTHDLRGAPR